MPEPHAGAPQRGRPGLQAAVAVALALAVLAAFAPSVRNGFVNFDDQRLFENALVRRGLTAEGVRWALTAVETQNWHPLTWLSHLLDFQLFGPWAGGHHAVSAALHAAAAAALFLALRAMTGALWRSAFAAAVFGLHPLRVESVAWAAERKDVLSVLFGLLALAAWVRFVRRRTPGSYAAAVGCHACALLSKSMLVSLPAILLLLDFWPFDRWPRAGARGAPAVPLRRLLLEKLPFLALSAAVGIVTFLVQRSGGAVAYVVQFPLGQRLANALRSCGVYLAKTLWPAKLAVFYPYYWSDVPWWQPALGAALLALTLAAAVLLARRRPALLVGWAWYVGTLLPVIGIVQVGSQMLADRYTYLPQVGVLLALLWGVGVPSPTRPRLRAALAAAALLIPAALAAATLMLVALWRDDLTLFGHAARVTGKNYIAYTRLGAALVQQGRLQEGRDYIALGLKLAPNSRANVFEATGDYYARLGMRREAAAQYRKALEIEPYKEIFREKLRALGEVGDAPAAPAADPHARPAPHGSARERGDFLARARRFEEAVAAYREAVRADPSDAMAWNNLGCALSDLGRREEAAAAFTETLRLQPDHPNARKNLEAVGGPAAPGAVRP